MKLSRTTFSLACIGVTSLAALVAQGCSSSSGTPETVTDAGSSSSSSHSSSSSSKSTSSGSKSTSGSSSSSSSSVNDKTDAGRPPQPVGDAMTTATMPHNLAIRNLYLGDSNADAPTFTTSMTAWENFGYNVDGLITTATSTDVCKLDTAAGATTASQMDGTNGIDNSFGENVVVPLLAGTGLISSAGVSADIAEGKFTLQVETIGLDGTATQSATGLTGQLFAGTTYDGTPPLTGTSYSITDNWPVNGSLLMAPGTAVSDGSQIQFMNAYITNGVWVSGQPATIALSLSIMGYSLSLTIHDGVITMPITVDASGQFHVKKGIVSGVLNTTELIAAINDLGGAIMGGAECTLITTVAIPDIEAAQDIIINGSTVSNTAGTACNGVSIGLGFDADEIAVPTTVAPTVDGGTPPAPCAAGDAG